VSEKFSEIVTFFRMRKVALAKIPPPEPPLWLPVTVTFSNVMPPKLAWTPPPSSVEVLSWMIESDTTRLPIER